VADVIADVRTLRSGYQSAGQWTLPKVCYHLTRSLTSCMKTGPFPDDSPEQLGRKPMIRQMLSSGKIPSGIDAPPQTAPPKEVSAAAIDTFLETLVQFDNYN